MRLSKEWLLLPALLKHKALQKPLSAFTGIKVGLAAVTVGNDEAVGSGIAVGLAFVFISTQWCYHENYTFASGFGTET